MLAGLSVAHALVPPHPAPTLAVATFHADAGKTILYAILVGNPTGILAGPFSPISRQDGFIPDPLLAPSSRVRNPPLRKASRAAARSVNAPGPSLPSVLTTILLPAVLMMSRSLADAFLPGQSFLKSLIDFVGDPIAALLIALFFGSTFSN